MKKFIYIVLVIVATSLTVSSCTEESVAPISDVGNGGANNSSDGKN